MGLYKVHFKWKEKDVELIARNLDMTHPYFVSIKDIVFPKKERLIIDPSQDEVRKRFGDTNHIMLPFQTVSLIEEIDEETEGQEKEKVRRFSVVNEGENDEKDE